MIKKLGMLQEKGRFLRRVMILVYNIFGLPDNTDVNMGKMWLRPQS